MSAVAVRMALVGKDSAESSFWNNFLEQIATGNEGQVVLLSGEPGIGKSRIIVALQERLIGEPHLNLRHFCSPYGTASALYPVITRIERAAGFEHGDGPGAKREKLQAFFATTATSGQDVALLMDLLSIEGDGASLGLSPHRKKENTLGALLRQLEALARQHPLLVKQQSDQVAAYTYACRSTLALLQHGLLSDVSPVWDGGRLAGL